MAMFDFGSIKKMLSNYTGQLKKLRSEIETLEREREDVLFAPPAQPDVRAAMAAWVEAHRDAYRTKLQKDLRYLAGNRHYLEQNPMVAKTTAVYRPGSSEQFLGGLDRVMCGIFGDVLIKSIDDTLSQLDWPKESLSAAERTRRLAGLDEKLALLREDEKKLVSAASEVGVNVSAVE